MEKQSVLYSSSYQALKQMRQEEIREMQNDIFVLIDIPDSIGAEMVRKKWNYRRGCGNVVRSKRENESPLMQHFIKVKNGQYVEDNLCIDFDTHRLILIKKGAEPPTKDYIIIDSHLETGFL